MANPTRIRKRVRAIHRAPDGSAFKKCNFCGVSVAIALADMHECESRKNVKRFKSDFGNENRTKQSFRDQPRSPFRLFMEIFLRTCMARNKIEVDRKGFETWKNMSKQATYVLQAKKVNSSYLKALLQEVEDMSTVDDDEADSADVGKYDKDYACYEGSENYDDHESFWCDL